VPDLTSVAHTDPDGNKLSIELIQFAQSHSDK